jgi:hypothetical protein
MSSIKSSTQTVTISEAVKRKHCNSGYWSAKYLKTYIEATLAEDDGSLNDIFKLDVENYKKLDGFTDKLPIKFRPVKNGPYVAFKVDTKKDKHTGTSYSETFDSGYIKIAKHCDTTMFVMEGNKYSMKEGVEPTADQCSATFAVIEYLNQFVEQEMAALIEQKIIALPSKKAKKGEAPSEAKIILRSKNDQLNTPIRYETKKGEEMCNPTALIKFQKNKDGDGTTYRLSRAVDATPDAEAPGSEITLGSKNIAQMIVPQTTIRALLALNAVNIYEQGISIACYVDSIQFSRPERKIQTDLGFDSEEDDEDDLPPSKGSAAAPADVDFD